VDLPSLLLRLLAFEVRMWRAKACRRSTLPLAVILKRFCAPRWVFNFSLIFLGFGNSTLQSVVYLQLFRDARLRRLPRKSLACRSEGPEAARNLALAWEERRASFLVPPGMIASKGCLRTSSYRAGSSPAEGAGAGCAGAAATGTGAGLG